MSKLPVYAKKFDVEWKVYNLDRNSNELPNIWNIYKNSS